LVTAYGLTTGSGIIECDGGHSIDAELDGWSRPLYEGRDLAGRLPLQIGLIETSCLPARRKDDPDNNLYG
jgi:hypothetical protein